MKWETAVQKEDKTVQIPESWLFLHYYEALSILFRVENALRIFVYGILKNELREKWLETNITSDDSAQGTINSIARRRINQAKDFGYLGYSIACPMMHLTSGELIQLITSEANWKYFSKYFSGRKEIIKYKLDEIGQIRNSLAHFRPIQSGDIEVVKQNANHVLSDIDKCISEMIGFTNIVPTNTTEEWYGELRTLGTENCRLSFFQSNSEQWAKISIDYNCPIIEKRTRLNYGYYKLLNILSSSILKEYPELCNLIIYLDEYVFYPSMSEELQCPDFRKVIELVLSRKTLQDNSKKLKDQIEQVLKAISTETEMIKQDNLARGKIVQAVSSNARLRDKLWIIYTDNLICGVSEEDPPEYWGQMGSFRWSAADFVSFAHQYPWMPAQVSNRKFPF